MLAVWPLVGRQEVLRRIAEAMRRPGCAGVVLDEASAALVHCLARTGTAQILATVRSGEQSADAVTALWKDDLAARPRRDKHRLELGVEILKHAAAYFVRENVLLN